MSRYIPSMRVREFSVTDNQFNRATRLAVDWAIEQGFIVHATYLCDDYVMLVYEDA